MELGKAKNFRFYVNGGLQLNYCLHKEETHVDLVARNGPVDDDVYGYSPVTTYLVAETGARFVFGNGNYLSVGVNYSYGLNNVFERENNTKLHYIGARGGYAIRIFR